MVVGFKKCKKYHYEQFWNLIIRLLFSNIKYKDDNRHKISESDFLSRFRLPIEQRPGQTKNHYTLIRFVSKTRTTEP